MADAGTVFAFIQYMDRFFQPLKEIADKYNSLQSALAGAERLSSFIRGRGSSNRPNESSS